MSDLIDFFKTIWYIAAHIIIFFALLGMYLYWLFADHDGLVEEPRRYRRMHEPTVAEQIDPLLRRSFERKSASA